FCFHLYCDLLHLHSFPTRRSSDLNAETHSLNNSSWDIAFRTTPMTVGTYLNQATKNWDLIQLFIEDGTSITAEDYFMNDLTSDRSEEHTSELQSRENLVCRLLLEK